MHAGTTVMSGRVPRWKRVHAQPTGVLLWAVLWLAAAAPLLWADDAGAVALIGDREVSRDELLAAAASDLEAREMEAMRCQAEAVRGRHDVLEASLRQLVLERLLELEAARTGTTVAAVEADIQAAAAPVRDQDIETFYERQPGSHRAPAGGGGGPDSDLSRAPGAGSCARRAVCRSGSAVRRRLSAGPVAVRGGGGWVCRTRPNRTPR